MLSGALDLLQDLGAARLSLAYQSFYKQNEYHLP